ncbi:MAG: hypothetical protein RIC89_06460 [Pseudomonadales bacterium]
MAKHDSVQPFTDKTITGKWLTLLVLLSCMNATLAVAEPKRDTHIIDKFRQLGHDLRDPNVYRNAAGAPGYAYWQQRADYRISATLDEESRRIDAEGTIEYTNNSPDTLPYLWLQLDQNRFRKDSIENLTRPGAKDELGADRLSFTTLRQHQSSQEHDYGYQLEYVRDGRGRDLTHTIVGTMMREITAPAIPHILQLVTVVMFLAGLMLA